MTSSMMNLRNLVANSGSRPASFESSFNLPICRASPFGVRRRKSVICLQFAHAFCLPESLAERVDQNGVKPIDAVPVGLERAKDIR